MKKWKVTRRDFMKYSAVGVAANALGVLGGETAQAATADNLEINIASYAYDRVGSINATGSDQTKVLTGSVFL